MVNLPEHAALNQLPEGLDLGSETLVLADHQQPAALPGFGRELGGIPGVGRHRFVEHHVFAGFQRGERDRGVEVVWQRDGDDLDVVAAQHLAVIGEEIRNVIGGDRGTSPLRVCFDQRDDAGGGVLLEARDVVPADGSGAEDRDVKEGRLLHGGQLIRRRRPGDRVGSGGSERCGCCRAGALQGESCASVEGGPPCPPQHRSVYRIDGADGLPSRSFSEGWRSALQDE